MKQSMKRQLAAVLITLLSVSAALPSYAGAAEDADGQARIHGWQQEEDGRWYYLSADGSRKTDEWVRGADGSQYYLDGDGYMKTSSVIRDGDRIYYVDENGVRVKNRWASESNAEAEVDCDQDDVDTLWYYFGADGRAKNTPNKPVRLKENGEEYKYFFDEDGHMLSGWQQIENKDGNYDTYYLGTQDEGYAHMRWQYLIPNEDLLKNAQDYDYDGYEMFYFGWDGIMSYNEESNLEGCYFRFDENGVMSTGWLPGIDVEPGDLNFGVNKYYDKVTGARASGWLYTWDPDDDESGDTYWFYCDKKDGQIYNEGGKDGDGGLAFKKIDGKTYFFDENGHMIYGLIATDGTELGDNPFVESEFELAVGAIGQNGKTKPAGIYYLSQKEESLGQLQRDGALRLRDGSETYDYYLSGCGRAYTNALIKGCVYGEDGLKITVDSGKEVITLDQNIYEKSAFVDGGDPEESGADPVIPAGSKVIINKSGKLTKKGKVKIEGTRYLVENYIAVEDPDQD